MQSGVRKSFFYRKFIETIIIDKYFILIWEEEQLKLSLQKCCEVIFYYMSKYCQLLSIVEQNFFHRNLKTFVISEFSEKCIIIFLLVESSLRERERERGYSATIRRLLV